MLKEMKITAQKRSVLGSSSVQRIRRQGILPGIVNTTKGESRLIQMNRHDFEMFLRHHTSESLILDLEIEGENSMKVLLKEVQHHPVSDSVLHVDFLEVSMTKKMRVNIPIRLIGDPVGVLSGGGVLDQLIRTVEVECLPGDLVEGIEVDVSALKVGDALLVKEIKIDPAKLRILTDGAVAVANVSIPKVVEETPEEAAAATTEPEVIGAKKEEGEEGAEGAAEEGKGEKAAAGKDEKAAGGDKKAAAPAADKKAPAKDKKG